MTKTEEIELSRRLKEFRYALIDKLLPFILDYEIKKVQDDLLVDFNSKFFYFDIW